MFSFMCRKIGKNLIFGELNSGLFFSKKIQKKMRKRKFSGIILIPLSAFDP